MHNLAVDILEDRRDRLSAKIDERRADSKPSRKGDPYTIMRMRRDLTASIICLLHAECTKEEGPPDNKADHSDALKDIESFCIGRIETGKMTHAYRDVLFLVRQHMKVQQYASE